jgi:hypothetical protein
VGILYHLFLLNQDVRAVCLTDARFFCIALITFLFVFYRETLVRCVLLLGPGGPSSSTVSCFWFTPKTPTSYILYKKNQISTLDILQMKY